MPLYSYRCQECRHEFDARQRMKDAPLTTCPVCGGRVQRLVGRVGIVFKGSGFYVTDNRNASSANGRAPTTAEKETKTKQPEAKDSKAKDSTKSTGKSESATTEAA